ncbi:ABC transporter substrate-binding protein [Pseudaminobacter sp. 19-2017]|uniref:ABC transporter substrate-binding protein n=1 Tax=Pseudaminobacter soli (ex Zhang et al. 2022) TaxID=2831468 RepID=A0A942E1H0_9HYPH|nr:ABC transporter substrate-binding protein [Pseudaminobacter soli]MBS3652034.1 ABC transporter substrate-binding protein [Pseudaminobacter soli]
MKLTRRILMAGSAILLASASTAAPSWAETAKIGVMNALTGPYAFGGVPIQNGMKLAIEQANTSGALGDLKLEVVEADSAGDKAQTITLVSKFAQSDNVLMILGPTTSLEATGGAPVANDQKVPLFAIGSSTAILDAGPYSYKVQQVGMDIMGHLSKYAAEKLGVKKVSLVFDRANDGFVGQKDAFKKLLVEEGVEIVSEEGILSSDTDFLALATKLASQDINAFFVAAPAEVGSNVLLQARQGGVPPEVLFLGPSTFGSESFITTAGGASEGAYVVADYFVGDPTPINQDFVRAYTEAYGASPDNWAAMGYALASLAVQAIKDAGPGPDRDKVKDALGKLRDQPTVLGTHVWTLDDKRNPSYGAAVITVKDGKFELAP